MEPRHAVPLDQAVVALNETWRAPRRSRPQRIPDTRRLPQVLNLANACRQVLVERLMSQSAHAAFRMWVVAAEPSQVPPAIHAP